MASKSPILKGARIDLVPFDLPLLRLVQADELRLFEQRLGAQVPAGWPNSDLRQYQFPAQIAALEADGALLPWYGRLMIEREPRLLVGGLNIKGPPRDGAAEIGYQVEPLFRRQGFAREACELILDWLFQQPGVQRVRAKTYANNQPSRHLLHRLGFELVGPLQDPALGEILLYDLTPEQATGAAADL